ncbi:PREDICTED: uncharacterized protein LOC109326884 [Lupinus angustifolius]|uniref:uncharacterized protein LOC109326884 n=1 Tax=Lupinus angustifolius TaxID=3871 RepID=UPI00092EBFAB|nr:PREDICTED: uncharacterized protein LOC109326884 [Lupinus angustifolius]
MECLTRMDFTDCKFLSEVPDVSGIPNLKTLYLENCISLIKIHDSVGSLGNLEELNAAGCTNLKSIPFAFKLPSLRFLSFFECSRLVRFPEILCKIENLRHLNLWHTAIEDLPFSIRNLVGLESLTLMDCTMLLKLPSSIFTLPRLQEIQADSCRGFSFPNECEVHGQLQLTVSSNKIHLYLSSCNLTNEHLAICLIGFAKVVYLDLSYNNFTVLPECIKECIDLKTLLLIECKQLQDIFVIPPKLDEIDALNCTSLTSQSSSVLLSQAFHDAGDKIVMLPGSIIPEWFDHCIQERSITFWGRKQFPKICVCAAFGVSENLPHHFRVRLSILINGEQRILSKCYSWSIVTDHVWLFDLRVLVNDSNLRGTFMKHDWNRVEVAFEDYQVEYSTVQVKHEPTRMATIKWFGIHVYRQENNMENILFTNATTLQESNGNFDRVSQGNSIITQSRDDGAFHDTYYRLCKRQCRYSFSIYCMRAFSRISHMQTSRTKDSDAGIAVFVRYRSIVYRTASERDTGCCGTDKIEGITLDYLPQGKEVVQLSGKAFKKMKNLRILIIKTASFSGVPKHLPNSLRLQIILPSSISNYYSFTLQNMECLTRMDFTDCKFLSEVPDVSGIPNLKTLYLENCISLIKIHDSVGSLGNLEELNAAGCTNLKSIPFAFKLPSLRFLSFFECSRLVRFPEILCKIENLRHLNLWHTAIEDLPFSIRNLVGLESLTLMDCTMLLKLPSSIFTLPRLQEIQADSCRGFSFPNECEVHGQLQLTVSSNKIHLYLSSCNLTNEHLAICLIGFAKVVYLDLSYNNFTVLPECIKECIDLKTLLLIECKQLQDIFVIPPKLDEIDALNCTSLTSQSSSVLLSQAFHDAGDKIVMLPGSIIPEWFDHCIQERSITFWGRKQFPKICVCAAFGVSENLPHHFRVRLSILINGEQRILSKCYSWSIVTDHVWLFDLRVLVNDSNLRGTFMKHDWNRVEVAFEDYQVEYSTVQVKHEPTRMATIKWFGIHVYRQENNMENILFTNATTLQESNGNFDRVSQGNSIITQSRDDGAFHDTYYRLCKRQCR